MTDKPMTPEEFADYSHGLTYAERILAVAARDLEIAEEMRERAAQHIPWSDGKCICGTRYYDHTQSHDPIGDWTKHILSLPIDTPADVLCSICDKPANPFTTLCEYCDPESSINNHAAPPAPEAVCPRCEGRGRKTTDFPACPDCHGTGKAAAPKESKGKV